MVNSDPCQALRELLATMHRLRAPQGCSWDAAQTPESLLPYLLEEACEVIEAIEGGDPMAIVDELGDLLLQIVFQAEIFAERGQFDFADVATAINRKLLNRHPHVFAETGEDVPLTAEGLEQQWERIKQIEQAAHQQAERHPLGILPGRLPALQRAQKLITRARRKGVAIRNLPVSAPPASLTEEALGEQLFALAAQADRAGLDAESALRRVIRRVLSETRADNFSPDEKQPPF